MPETDARVVEKRNWAMPALLMSNVKFAVPLISQLTSSDRSSRRLTSVRAQVASPPASTMRGHQRLQPIQAPRPKYNLHTTLREQTLSLIPEESRILSLFLLRVSCLLRARIRPRYFSALAVGSGSGIRCLLQQLQRSSVLAVSSDCLNC